jgi:hypothetical protein
MAGMIADADPSHKRGAGQARSVGEVDELLDPPASPDMKS